MYFMANLLLKDVQEDVLKFILKKQGDMKVEKGVAQYSISLTVFKLLKEHPDFKKKKD